MNRIGWVGAWAGAWCVWCVVRGDGDGDGKEWCCQALAIWKGDAACLPALLLLLLLLLTDYDWRARGGRSQSPVGWLRTDWLSHALKANKVSERRPTARGRALGDGDDNNGKEGRECVRGRAGGGNTGE